MKRTIKSLSLVVMALALFACSSVRQFNAMSLQERGEYIAIADKMTVPQRKEYLAKGTGEARLEYLKEINLYDEFMHKAAFQRLDNEKRTDFLRAYLNATPEEIQKYLAAYNDSERDRIVHKDLQHGWNNKEVILALGKPADILENNTRNGTNQLWVYDNQPEVATYIYFENGMLTNWAK